MSLNSIEAKGRNVEEAIGIALKQLKEDRENVTIEVLEHPEDRLFGLFVKPAIVKVTRKTKNEADGSDEEKKETDERGPLKPGMIEISDGNVRHSATEESKPTIIPCEHLTVMINGKKVTGKTEVQPEDNVEIQKDVIAKEEGSFDIYVDDSKLSATLDIIVGFIEQSVPLDVQPATSVELKAKTVKTPYISFSKANILQQLKERNITFGIDENAVEEALERKQSGEVMIAKGEPPTEGKDGYIEFYIQYEMSEQKPKLLEDGTVDFREIREIPVVEVGEKIGIIHEPTEGKHGRTIQNRPVQPRKVHEAIVKGRGFFIDNNTIFASESGTIRVRNRAPIYEIDIIQKLVHHGDVDLKSGNLSFVGDIEITGNVEETMSVEADERILIMQNVHGATIEAGNEIYVNRNIIRSKLTVGKVDDDELTVKDKTEELLNTIKSLEQSVLQLVLANRKSGLPKTDIVPLVRILMEQKFQSLSSDINKYFQLLHEHTNNELVHLNELIDLLHKAFVLFDKQLLNDEMVFLTIEEKLTTLYRYYAEKLEPTGKLTIGQAQQSEAFCNGDIYLTGRGAYNSKFHAEGKFVTNGFIRGGSIFAKKGIEVNEVGSGFGVETILSVPATEKIIINHAKEDTVIQIGKRIYRFVKEKRHIQAQLDETGNIALS